MAWNGSRVVGCVVGSKADVKSKMKEKSESVYRNRFRLADLRRCLGGYSAGPRENTVPAPQKAGPAPDIGGPFLATKRSFSCWHADCK